MSKRLTPKEILFAEKERIRNESLLLEKKINEDFIYVKDNMGKIAFSYMRSMLRSDAKEKRGIENKGVTQTTSPREDNNSYGVTSVAREMLPFAWDIAKPFIIAWGARKAQQLFRGLFHSKKRRK